MAASTTAESAGGRSRQGYLIVAAVAFAVLAWASAFVAIRRTVTHIDPGALACGRLVLGSLVLGAMLLARRRWVRPTAREWGLLVLCGITWFALYNLFLNVAEQHVDAGTTSMLVNVGPIVIAVLAGLLLGEGFPRWLMVGFAIAFAGVIVIGVATTSGDATLGGVLMCLAAAGVYAIGVLAQKPVLRRLPALQVTWIACTVGAIGCLPFVGQLSHDLGTAPTESIAGLVYLAVVPLAGAFSAWSYALARMPAGRIAVTVYAVPPVTVLLGWALLDQVPPGLAFVGGAICLAGVGVSRRRGRPLVAEKGDVQEAVRACLGDPEPATDAARRGSGVRSEAGDVAGLAAALADPTRMSMCLALIDGRAWTAGELASRAGVAPSTASEHLTLLVACGLLAEDRQGRHRYVRLADDQVAHILEELSSRCPPRPGGRTSLRDVRVNRELAFARTCYDHLAGRLGVAAFDAMLGRGLLESEPQLALTPSGREWLTHPGVRLSVDGRSRRPQARACMDWTERRHHLAGIGGAALLAVLLARDWVRRRPGERSLVVTADGADALSEHFGIDVEALRRQDAS